MNIISDLLKSITRKEFIVKFAGILLVPLIFFWDKEIVRHIISDRTESVTKIPAAVKEGVSFIDDFIIVKGGDKIKIFSARCTHLGCRLNKLDSGQIVCPCHGSRFSIDGMVLKGPANKSLVSLSYKLNTRSNELIINAAE